ATHYVRCTIYSSRRSCFIHSLFFFFSTSRPPPGSTLFPYTTLFRSRVWRNAQRERTRNRCTAMRCSHDIECIASIRYRENSALRSEEHTSELQSRSDLVCRLLLEKKKKKKKTKHKTRKITAFICCIS